MSLKKHSTIVKMILYIVISTLSLMLSPWIVENHRYANAIWLLLIAVGGYFFIAFAVASRNWMDIRAVFHAVWIFTIMLASLQLTDYQEDWQVKTWMCMAGAYAMFQIGANLGMHFGKRQTKKVLHSFSKFRIGRVSFSMHQERLFWVCLGTTLIGLACFIINVMIRGYIPAFSDDPNAYLTFYTRFHVFSVAATAVSGLCYYVIKTQDISTGKKIVMWLCILYTTILFPMLVVSRGTFVTAAISLTVSVFYLNRKKLWVLVVCVAMILGAYAGVSVLRGYADAQLVEFFEPKTISMQTHTEETEVTEAIEVTEQTVEATEVTEQTTEATVDAGTEEPDAVFQLPAKLAFAYGYLSVSHDNFNEAVQNSTQYTYGLRQIAPFNVILRSSWIEETIASGEYYLVREHLNTTNLIGDAYYDLHEWGVLLFMFLWSFAFGVIQAFREESQGPISLSVLGNVMTPVALCFFATWMSNFSLWLIWGTQLLAAIAASIQFEPRTGKEK